MSEPRLPRAADRAGLSARALAAARALARDHGLPGEPRVLHDGANATFALPGPGVALRVASVTGAVRPARGAAWLAREVAVAAHLAAAGAPGPRPSPRLPPGPHEREGLAVAAWALLDVAGPADPAAAGRALRDLHRALAGMAAPLPVLVPLQELPPLLAALARDGDLCAADVDLVRGVAADGLAAAAHRPAQALHGDAFLGNAVTLGDGSSCWIDLEDACRGPREWDAACLVAAGIALGRHPERGRAALDAYGDDLDAAVLGALVAARVAQAVAWAALFGRFDGDHRAAARARIAWLREGRGGAGTGLPSG